MNAVNAQMQQDLGRVWEDFRDDDNLWVAILSGNGRCFCTGADLTDKPPTRYTGIFPDISTTHDVYKPIVVALHSYVIGRGLWIALDSDIRIATDDIQMWLPEPQSGAATLPAAWLPRMMPWAIASELLLLTNKIDAQRAYQLGLVNKVVPQDQLMAEAEKAAERICELAPMAVRGMKELMVKASRLDYTAVSQMTAWVQDRVTNSEDRQEGRKAFMEKRKPQWKGI